MARLLVELKLRLVRNALRSSTAAQVTFLISTLCAAVAAIGIFWLLAQLRSQNAAVDLTTVIFGIFLGEQKTVGILLHVYFLINAVQQSQLRRRNLLKARPFIIVCALSA